MNGSVELSYGVKNGERFWKMLSIVFRLIIIISNAFIGLVGLYHCITVTSIDFADLLPFLEKQLSILLAVIIISLFPKVWKEHTKLKINEDYTYNNFNGPVKVYHALYLHYWIAGWKHWYYVY